LSGTEFVEEIGRENILPNVQTALARARELSADFNRVGLEIAEDMRLMKI
jgi:SulP family sulfate permease